ncbi:hypothetical protein AURDEDRAFT_184598 [Auricularia subglabra TFB-10046 SS5]|nr:hypothetical protein AURDEDRAFT_184598 [Auricularia subglabra TFB-10046 SS5]
MLDVAGHLSSFGWKGHGTALREGAITRPLLVSQKKSLSGLGKDRDEAYPFWDHVFAAAAKTITIKIAGSDDEQSSDDDASNSKRAGTGTIARTKTGIISNRRPTSTCTTPGDATPDLVSDATTSSSSSAGSQLSIMAQAKREAAKRALYARFYRGPVIKSEVDAEAEEPTKKKRKRGGDDDDSDSSDDDNVGTHWRTLAAAVTAPAANGKTADKAARKLARAERKAARAERRALRAAKREAKRAKEERKEQRRKADEVAPVPTASGDDSGKKKKKQRDSSVANEATSEVEKPKKKKKRKTDE